MDISKKIISAVIACYNDSQAIPEMHQRLTSTFKKIGVNYEIIFVNDGSTDDSELVLKKICAKDKKTTVKTRQQIKTRQKTSNTSNSHQFKQKA